MLPPAHQHPVLPLAAAPVSTAAVLGGVVLLGGAAFAASFPKAGGEEPAAPALSSSSNNSNGGAAPPVCSPFQALGTHKPKALDSRLPRLTARIQSHGAEQQQQCSAPGAV